MIYFIRDTGTGAIKIGYSKNPGKRMTGLQSATASKLEMIGTMQGGLEHEAEFQDRFKKHHLQGEWYKGDIFPEIQEILRKAATEPEPKRMNVIIAGDTFFRDRATVFQALDEQHAKTPIWWVIIGGNQRSFDLCAAEWARKNNVKVYYYWPKWKTYGKFAGFKVGRQMLNAMFDPKTLMVFMTTKPNSSTLSLIRQAEKAGIEVVKKTAAPTSTFA
jgi:hypothetical protein